MIGVSRMHYVITIAVKNDGRDKRLLVFENVRSFTGRGKNIVNRLAAWRRMQKSDRRRPHTPDLNARRLRHKDPGRLPPSRRPQRLRLIIRQHRLAAGQRNSRA